MTMESPQTKRREFNPDWLTFILLMVLQLGGMVWWGSNLTAKLAADDQRITMLETQKADETPVALQLAEINRRLAVIEENTIDGRKAR